MEDIDGGLHPAVEGQSLDEDEDEVYSIMSIIFVLFVISEHDTLSCSFKFNIFLFMAL